jgi:hypothetical protein
MSCNYLLVCLKIFQGRCGSGVNMGFGRAALRVRAWAGLCRAVACSVAQPSDDLSSHVQKMLHFCSGNRVGMRRLIHKLASTTAIPEPSTLLTIRTDERELGAFCVGKKRKKNGSGETVARPCGQVLGPKKSSSFVRLVCGSTNFNFIVRCNARTAEHWTFGFV